MELFPTIMNLTDQSPEGRVEARAKVTGSGRYSADYEAENLAYAVMVESTIAAGKIKSIDTATASLAEGVLAIFTHGQQPLLPLLTDEAKVKEMRLGLPVLHTDNIYFKGQPIALVVAASPEEARYAASLIKATYEVAGHTLDFGKAAAHTELKPQGKERGTEPAWAGASYVVEAEYQVAAEVHNPMEMHATLAQWLPGGKLKVYDKTQGVVGVQRLLARLFGLKNEDVEVMAEFVGGGFGSGLRVWSNTVLAALAARQLNRPVKLMLTRPQMFALVGHRPQSWQRLRLGADDSGRLMGLVHEARNSTSVYENFTENITGISRLVYQLPNLRTAQATVPLNLGTPTWMRGPGDCTGAFGLETAMDELAARLGMDPVALRLKNIAATHDPETGKPWSTHFLPECITMGREKFGWKAAAAGRRRTEGDWIIGQGMAVGMWGAGRRQASAGMSLRSDGRLVVRTAMTDIGTGTGTALQNIAAETLGQSKALISVELGNSNLPPAPSQGGSTGLSSISGAVAAAADALRKKLLPLAVKTDAGWATALPEELQLENDFLTWKGQPGKQLPLAGLWQENGLQGPLEVEAASTPGEERAQFSFCCSAAHFVELKVHRRTGKLKVSRLLTVADGGRIVNELAAANQMSGAAVGGIGMALMEALHTDDRLGSLVSHDFAGYHVPVNADAPLIEVHFIGKPDYRSNPSGAKGLGEVGIIGVAPAIGNALYAATGLRLRQLPFTPDKVVPALQAMEAEQR